MSTPTHLGVRLVWAYLRLLRESGDDKPLDWPFIRKEIQVLREAGIPIPEGDDWWR